MGKGKVVIPTLALAAVTGLTLGSNAYATGPQNCFVAAHTSHVRHAATTHRVSQTTLGSSAIAVKESRGSRTILPTPAVTHQANQYRRTIKGTLPVTQEQSRVDHEIPASDEVSHIEKRFRRTVKGTPEKTELRVRVDKRIPGTTAVSHKEHQFKKVVEGTPDVTELRVRVDHEIPGQEEVSHPEYRFRMQAVIDGKTVTVYKTTSGQTTVKADADWFTTGSFPGWTEFATKTVVDKEAKKAYLVWRTLDGGSTTDPVNRAGWFPLSQLPELRAQGWYQYFQPEPFITPGTPDVVYYKTATGQTTVKADAGWFTTGSFSGWTEFATKTIVDQEGKEAYVVWRTLDGGTTTDPVNKAGWFPLSQLPELESQGWSQYGHPDPFKVTDGTPDVTYYLVVNKNGSQSETTNEAHATWVNPKLTSVGSQWSSFDTRTEVDRKGVKDHLEWLTQNGGSTSDVNKAGYFPVSQLPELRDQGWFAYGAVKTTVIKAGTPDVVHYLVVNKNGSQSETTNKAHATLVNVSVNVGPPWAVFHTETVVDEAAKPGYTLYFSPTGPSTRSLTKGNWTTQLPIGWKVVGSKLVVIKPATATVTVHRTVVDRPAWTETKKVRAHTDKECLAALKAEANKSGGSATKAGSHGTSHGPSSGTNHGTNGTNAGNSSSANAGSHGTNHGTNGSANGTKSGHSSSADKAGTNAGNGSSTKAGTNANGSTATAKSNSDAPSAKTGLNENNNSMLPWGIGGVVLLAVGVIALIAARRRREGKQD